MSQFGGKDSKRHFTVVKDNKEQGLYFSSTPSSAAKKAVTKLCASNKSKKVEFYIREITQGSKKKIYGPYTGYIEKLKEPIELKGRVIRYKPIAKLNKKLGAKKIMRGGEKTREDLLRVANDWIGHGIYVRDNNNISLIIENDNAKHNSEQYIPNDFIINFTNYGQFEPIKELYDFLYNYSNSRYREKSLAMNCWQFVLLCLLESGYINEDELKLLYHNYDINKKKDKRIPDYFSKKYSDKPEPGDIILFQRKRDGIIWHVAILSKINIEDDVINYKYIDMLGDKVSENNNIINEKKKDNLLFIKPENLLEKTLLNQDIQEIKHATYDKILLRKFLVNILFKDDILSYSTQKLEDFIKSIPEPINYQELFKELEPRQYKIIKNGEKIGINYKIGNSNFYEKESKKSFIENPGFKNDILRSYGLLHYVV